MFINTKYKEIEYFLKLNVLYFPPIYHTLMFTISVSKEVLELYAVNSVYIERVFGRLKWLITVGS